MLRSRRSACGGSGFACAASCSRMSFSSASAPASAFACPSPVPAGGAASSPAAPGDGILPEGVSPAFAAGAACFGTRTDSTCPAVAPSGTVSVKGPLPSGALKLRVWPGLTPGGNRTSTDCLDSSSAWTPPPPPASSTSSTSSSGGGGRMASQLRRAKAADCPTVATSRRRPGDFEPQSV